MLIPFLALAIASQDPTPPAAAPAATAPATAPATTTPPKVEAPKASSGGSVGFKDGFFIQSDDGQNKIVIHAMMQPRAEVRGSDADVSTWSDKFAIQRAQLELGGTVFTKDLGYQLKLEMGQGFTFLKDAWFNYIFVPEVLELRVGLGKRPFSRQQLTGDTKLGFVDRSETDAFFKSGRDIGVSVHNNIDKSRPLEWSAGLFAGAADKPTFTGDVDLDKKVVAKVKESNVADPFAPTLVGRIGFNQGDVKGYNEIDTDGGDLRFGIAGSALETIEPTKDQSRGATRAEIDGIVKVIGIDASGALFASTKQTKGEQSFAQELEAIGVHGQVGYMIAGMVHPGFRYDLIQQADDTTLQELTGGLTVFVFNQNVAVQLDGTALLSNDPEKPATELRSRAQLNLWF